MDEEERVAFEILQTVTGIGPRTAQAVLAVLTVDEDEIAPACFRLARLGFYVEPTSSVVGAAVSRLLKTGAIRPDERTAAVLTGTGLKATDKILHLAERNEGGRPTLG